MPMGSDQDFTKLPFAYSMKKQKGKRESKECRIQGWKPTQRARDRLLGKQRGSKRGWLGQGWEVLLENIL